VATVIDCGEPHDGQVFQTDVALVGLNPLDTGVMQWIAAASTTCKPGFQRFVGYAMPPVPGIAAPTTPLLHAIEPPSLPVLPSLERFQFAIVITSPEGAAPVVACAVEQHGMFADQHLTTTIGEDGRTGFALSDKRSNKWTGSAEDTSGSYAGIVPGDCFDFPTSITAAQKLSCDQPHDAEMFIVAADLGIDAPDTPYPTEEEWGQIAIPICEDQFAAYTGIPLADAFGLSYTYIYPLKKVWADLSQRILSCAVIAEDETKLVGKKRA
jgi:hypothetical protein